MGSKRAVSSCCGSAQSSSLNKISLKANPECFSTLEGEPNVGISSLCRNAKSFANMGVIAVDLSNVVRLALESSQNDSNTVSSSSLSIGKKEEKARRKNVQGRKHVHPFNMQFRLLPYPRGIFNAKNICFMNAILQVLIFIPSFAQLAVSVADGPTSFGSLSPTMSALGKWFKEYWKPGLTRSSLMPPHFCFLAKIAIFIRDQHDAHEFLQCLLEQADDELMKLEEEKLSNGASQVELLPSSVSKVSKLKGWTVVQHGKEKLQYRMHTGRHSLLLTSLLGGLLESRVSGNVKNCTSATVQPFFTLSLHISFKSSCTVEEALEHELQKETVFDSCSSPLQKVTLFAELPRILILHFCRWSVTALREVVKIDNEVVYHSMMSIPPHLCANSQLPPLERLYRLVSAVAHRGTQAQVGHYVTYLSPEHVANPFSFDGRNSQRSFHLNRTTFSASSLHSQEFTTTGSNENLAATRSSESSRNTVPNNHFILCDDTNISLVNETALQKESIYLLVYEKVSR